MCRSSGLVAWTMRWGPRRGGRSRQTPCCSRRRRPRWTCSGTTPSGARSSPPPCARGGAMTTSLPAVRSPKAGARPKADAPSPPRRRPAAPDARAPLLARPLASYYLVLSSAGLLLVLGLVMVLSASSVRSYAQSGSSFAVFVKQAIWVGIGLPVLVVASRLPVRVFRWLAYPLLAVTFMLLLVVLIPGVGVSINGARRWIGVGAYTVQPSEIAKLALALWGADLLVRKTRLLCEWKHLLIPLVPVATVVYRL